VSCIGTVNPFEISVAIPALSVTPAAGEFTFKAVEPFTDPDVAVIVVIPVVIVVASPELLIVATAVLDEDQVAVLERSCVLLSLKVPVAVNCCVFPAATD
jgi:hypothetical protein